MGCPDLGASGRVEADLTRSKSQTLTLTRHSTSNYLRSSQDEDQKLNSSSQNITPKTTTTAPTNDDYMQPS